MSYATDMRSFRAALLPFALLTLFTLAACDKVVENVVLMPPGEKVEFAFEAPSDNSYEMIGAVEGSAAGTTENEAEQSARNDTRNKAAALGASLVMVDSLTGQVMRLQNKTKVVIKARAYKARD